MSRRGRILIVDDLETWRNQIASALQRGGFLTDPVATPTEALNHLKANLYHILILDIRMEDSDLTDAEGINLLHRLYEGRLTDAIKVIVLSAYGTEDYMRQAFR